MMPVLEHVDDKKQKHQSHEIYYHHNQCGVDETGTVDLTGFGASHDEALANFITGAETLQQQLQAAIERAYQDREQLNDHT